MPLATNEYQLNLAGSGEVTINWGDGVTESVALTSAVQTFRHTYSAVNRYLIEITGPGTVTSTEAIGTNTSNLEEIRSFGELGLETFQHSLTLADTEWTSATSFLREIPESIPNTLKNIPNLLANTIQPPISKTGTWDWSNLENVSGFLKGAENFDFNLQNQTLPNLKNLTHFATDAKRATFYLDNVQLTNPEVDLAYMFGAARNCEINFHRVTAHTPQVRNVFQGSDSLTLNWTDVSFPVAADINHMVNYCRGMRVTINGLNIPQATSATSAFALGGSIHGPSNNPEDNAKLIISRLHCPALINASNMFSGWSHADVNLILPPLTTVTNFTGFLSFTVGSNVKVSGLQFGSVGGIMELATHSYHSQFQFNGLHFGSNTSVTHVFSENTNCGFEINGLTVAQNASVRNTFIASKSCRINVPNATFGGNNSLVGFFGNLRDSSIVSANNWVFQGDVELTRVLGALSGGSEIVADNWIFQGGAELSNLASLNQPTLNEYVGATDGVIRVSAKNWVFNGIVRAEDRINSGTEGGILSVTNNSVIDFSGWEFNNTASVNLGNNLRSSAVNLRNWQFNADVDLTNFAKDVGYGNLSQFTLDLTDWTFSGDHTVIVDGIFADFAKRAPALFGDKPNYPTTLIGLTSWPRDVYSSAVNVGLGAGPDVVGLDLSVFS